MFDIVYYSQACALPDPITDTVLVTGGLFSSSSVTRYGQQGWLEDLPTLITGRYSHACSSFMSSGRLVSKYKEELLSGFFTIFYMKVVFRLIISLYICLVYLNFVLRIQNHCDCSVYMDYILHI